MFRNEHMPKSAQKQRSNELISEVFNRINRETMQTIERWNNRLVVSPTKLAQRYLSGHIDLHIHLGFTRGNKVSRPYFPRPKLTMPMDLDSPDDIKFHNEDGQYKFPVLVENVHVMDEPKGMASWISDPMWLQSVDSCQSCGTRDSLYLSTVSANFLFCSTAKRRRLVKDGELDSTWEICLHVGRGQLPGDVIECGAQVMNDFSSKHAEHGRNSGLLNELGEFFKCFAVYIGDDRLVPIYTHSDRGSGKQELSDFPIEILDILIGPF